MGEKYASVTVSIPLNLPITFSLFFSFQLKDVQVSSALATFSLTHHMLFCVCPAQIVGLVNYPATNAPESGSLTVEAKCADNAHVRSGSSLSVRCTSSGSWSGNPKCECDTGYEFDGKYCTGKILSIIAKVST